MRPGSRICGSPIPIFSSILWLLSQRLCRVVHLCLSMLCLPTPTRVGPSRRPRPRWGCAQPMTHGGDTVRSSLSQPLIVSRLLSRTRQGAAGRRHGRCLIQEKTTKRTRTIQCPGQCMGRCIHDVHGLHHLPFEAAITLSDPRSRACYGSCTALLYTALHILMLGAYLRVVYPYALDT